MTDQGPNPAFFRAFSRRRIVNRFVLFMRRFDDTMVQPCAKSSVATSSCKSNAHLKRNSLAYLTRKSGVTVGGNWTPGFAARLHHYDYGRSPKGDYALPKTLEILDRQGLKEVFFIEPPVAARFGIEHLAFIINLTQSGGHDIQRHLHLEWTDVQGRHRTPAPTPGRCVQLCGTARCTQWRA